MLRVFWERRRPACEFRRLAGIDCVRRAAEQEQASGLCSPELFLVASDVLMISVRVQRGPDTQKNLEPIAKAISVIAIEAIRPIIDRKLTAQADVDLVAVR